MTNDFVVEPDFQIDQSRIKLNLVSLGNGKVPLKKKDKVYASVSVKYSTMTIGKYAQAAMGMAHKLYKLSYDSDKRVIAWLIKEAMSGEELKMGWRMARPEKNTGLLNVGVGRILNTFDGLKQTTYKCEIKKYKEYGLMASGETYYYVEIKPEV